MKNRLQIDVSFDQLLDLVKQLPDEEKIKLSMALENDAIYSKFSALLKVFKTDEISDDDIASESALVRKNVYETRKS